MAPDRGRWKAPERPSWADKGDPQRALRPESGILNLQGGSRHENGSELSQQQAQGKRQFWTPTPTASNLALSLDPLECPGRQREAFRGLDLKSPLGQTVPTEGVAQERRPGAVGAGDSRKQQRRREPRRTVSGNPQDRAGHRAGQREWG